MGQTTNDIASLRKEYALASLSEQDCHSNPIVQFAKWFDEAVAAEIDDANAMTLCTVDADAKPHARIVLLKGVAEQAFLFYTNYDSAKGRQMAINANVSLVFHWKELQRQVRIEGVVSKISEEASAAYFHSRPIDSQLGAWASQQSDVLQKREDLEKRFEDYKIKYQNIEIPKPPNWGGYQLEPCMIEFWQGRANRLHDRLQFTLLENVWRMCRLNP